MVNKRLVEIIISMHKRVNVNALSEAEWRDHQRERQDLNAMLKHKPKEK